MGILRPITKGQVEISLSRDDGEMTYDGAFIFSSKISTHLKDGKLTYEPIVIKSPFDPVYYKDLLNYCIEWVGTRRGPEATFTLEVRVHNALHLGREVWCQFQVTGCEIIGYSLPEFDRESVEVAEFSITLQPKGICKILTQ